MVQGSSLSTKKVFSDFQQTVGSSPGTPATMQISKMWVQITLEEPCVSGNGYLTTRPELGAPTSQCAAGKSLAHLSLTWPCSLSKWLHLCSLHCMQFECSLEAIPWPQLHTQEGPRLVPQARPWEEASSYPTGPTWAAKDTCKTKLHRAPVYSPEFTNS